MMHASMVPAWALAMVVVAALAMMSPPPSDAWMATTTSSTSWTRSAPAASKLSYEQGRRPPPSGIISSPTTSGTTATTRLSARKARGAGGGDTAAAAANTRSKNAGWTGNLNNNNNPGPSGVGHKIQVKLLRHVAGTGDTGDVVWVNPAFYNNKLRAQGLAKKVTPEEIMADQARAEATAAVEMATAVRLQTLWGGGGGGGGSASDNVDDNKSQQPPLSPFVLTIGGLKTGPDGHKLFGGIGPKKLLQELVGTTTVAADADLVEYVEKSRHVKVLEIIDDDEDGVGGGGPLKGDIKQTGRYTVTVSLLRTDQDHIFVKIPLVVKGAD